MSGRYEGRRLLALVGSLALLIGLAACTEEEAPPPRIDGLSVVIGARSNMPAGNLRGESAERARAAVHWEALMSVVVADGAPFQHMEAVRLPVNENNPVVAGKNRSRNLAYLAQQIEDARAKTPESDLLAALDVAARSIDGAEQPKTIVVVDSGLSTTGALDLTQPGMLDSDPDALAAQLAEAGVLPDLNGIEVVLQGIGDTAPPQPRLGQRQRDNLVAIWEAIVLAAGADDVVVVKTPIEAPPLTDVPDVSAVPVSDGGVCTVETVELDGGEVAFEPESADFVDRSVTLAVLRPLAERIVSGSFSGHLTGTTADVGDGKGQRELSLARADAVKAVLVELGVPAEQISTEGVGSDFDGHVEEYDADGELVEELAAANRKVLVDLQRGESVDCT